MSFAKNINAISKPRLHKFIYDFGGDVGEQEVCIRELSYKDRAELFVSRWDDSGKIDPRTEAGGLYLNAELLARTVSDASGKLLLTKDALMNWPPSVMDGLTAKVLEIINPPKDESADPSAATS